MIYVYIYTCTCICTYMYSTDEHWYGYSYLQFLCYYIYFNILFSLVFELNTYKNVCLITLPRFYLHRLMPWAGDMAF